MMNKEVVFIVLLQISQSCPVGYTLISQSCWKVICETYKTYNFEQAKVECISDGAELAVPTNDEINTWIFNQVRKLCYEHFDFQSMFENLNS